MQRSEFGRSPPYPKGLGATFEGRMPEVGHAVQRLRGDPVFGDLAVQFSCVELWPDDGLVTSDLGLHESAVVVSRH